METTDKVHKTGWFQRVFVNRNIFNLWVGQIISQSGDSIFEIGLLWLLLELTGSNAITGMVAMSAYLPTLMFGLFSGALVDRFDRRRLMLFSDAIRAVIILFIPLLYWLDGLNGLMLGIITFILASFNSLFNPARDALVGQLIKPEEQLAANSMIQTSWQYAMFIGPAVAGILLAIVGEVHLISLDALTFLASFYFIYKIKTNKTGASMRLKNLPLEFKASWKDMIEGLGYVKKDRRIGALLLFTAVDNFVLMGPAIIGAPIFVREILKEDASSYAFVQVAYAVGMVLGTILLRRFGGALRKSQLIQWGVILDGITFVPLFWVTSFSEMFITITIHAMAIPMIIVARPNIILTIVPSEMQGRVFSLMSVCVFGLTALSIALTGIIAEIIPMNVIYLVIGIIAASTGTFGWFIKEFRELK
ncbi:MFS transporter [bacterium]|nr:MFS transporter [bacterium]